MQQLNVVEEIIPIGNKTLPEIREIVNELLTVYTRIKELLVYQDHIKIRYYPAPNQFNPSLRKNNILGKP